MTRCLQWIHQKSLDMMSFCILNEKEKLSLKYLCIFSGLYLLPLILANSYYIDDIGRFSTTNFLWMRDGRPLMQIMAACLGFGKPYLNIFPLGQLLAVFAFDYVLVLWGRKYFVLQNPLLLAGFLGLGYLNLFLLESFSYVYESLGMMLSLCFPIFLYSLSDTLLSIHKFLLTLFSVILSLSFYQAAIGAFVVLAFIELCKSLFENQKQKSCLKQFVIRMAGIMTGIVIYLVLTRPLINGYGAEHSSLLPFFTNRGYRQLINHLLIYYHRYQIFFRSTHKVVRGLFLFIYAIGTTIVIKRLWDKRNRNLLSKMGCSCLYIIFPLLLMGGFIAPFAFLENPVYAPRIFLSFSILFLYLALLLYQLVCRFFLAKFLLIPMLLFALSYSAGYGNLLYQEDRHDRFIAQSIANELNRMEGQHNKLYKKITFIGREPECLELKRQEKKRPLMELLVPIYMNNNWYWGTVYLDHYRNAKTILVAKTQQDTEIVKCRKSFSQNEFYDLYDADDKAIIVFHGRS